MRPEPDPIELASGADHRFMPRLDRKIARSLIRKRARLTATRPLMTISFDDIPANAATTGAKILEDQGLHGTFFVASGLLSKRFGPWTFASMSEISTLDAAGHEIGCHTYAHPNCQTLSPVELEADLARNAAALHHALPGLALESFAYPYGSVGRHQKRAMLGRFKAARGTHPAINTRNLDLAQLSSFTLNDAKTPPARLEALLAETAAIGGWLVLHTHDVADQPTTEGCSPALLRTAIKLGLAAGFDIMPFRDAMTYVARDEDEAEARIAA